MILAIKPNLFLCVLMSLGKPQEGEPLVSLGTRLQELGGQRKLELPTEQHCYRPLLPGLKTSTVKIHKDLLICTLFCPEFSQYLN